MLALGIALYVTFGAYWWIYHRRGYRTAELAARKAYKIEGVCNDCVPTPVFMWTVMLMIALPVDLLLWPFNEVYHQYLVRKARRAHAS